MLTTPHIVNRKDVFLLVVDLQERLLPAMHSSEALVSKVGTLMQGFVELDLPMVFSEQYPKGLGHTVEPLQVFMKKSKVFEKTKFSCVGVPEFEKITEEINRKQCVLCGIESHVCILQTAMDLLAKGFEVFIPRETTESRNPEDRLVALERMKFAGASVTCIESVLFEILRDKNTAEFKQVAQLIR